LHLSVSLPYVFSAITTTDRVPGVLQFMLPMLFSVLVFASDFQTPAITADDSQALGSLVENS
jgi:hypothetical protein